MPRASYPPPIGVSQAGGLDLVVDVVTMVGTEYAIFVPSEAPSDEPEPPKWWFPSDLFAVGESPAAAARRVVAEWTGTQDPKLELVDFAQTPPSGAAPWRLSFVFRGMLTSEPRPGPRVKEIRKVPRGTLPDLVGRFEARWIEDALKTSLSYKLTRR